MWECQGAQCAQPCADWVGTSVKGWGRGRPRIGLVESPILTDSGELFPVQATSSLGSGFRFASFRRRPLGGRPGSAIEAASRSRRRWGTGENQAAGQAGSCGEQSQSRGPVAGGGRRRRSEKNRVKLLGGLERWWSSVGKAEESGS